MNWMLPTLSIQFSNYRNISTGVCLERGSIKFHLDDLFEIKEFDCIFRENKLLTVALRFGLVSLIAFARRSLSRKGRKPILPCHASNASSPALRKWGWNTQNIQVNESHQIISEVNWNKRRVIAYNFIHIISYFKASIKAPLFHMLNFRKQHQNSMTHEIKWTKNKRECIRKTSLLSLKKRVSCIVSRVLFHLCIWESCDQSW